MTRPACVFLLFFLLVSCSAPGGPGGPPPRPLSGAVLRSPAELLGAALDEARLGQEGRAAEDLQFIRLRYEGTEWSSRASLVLGLQASRSANWSEAVRYLQEAQDLGLIRPYVLLRLARAYSAAGGALGAERTYSSIEAEYPDFFYMADVLFEHAEVLEALGRSSRAIRLYSAFAKKYPDHRKAPQALLKGALLQAASGRPDEARKDLRRLLVEYAGGPQAREARRLTRENRRLSMPALGAEERCRRSEALFKGYYYRAAAEELSAMVRRAPGACGGRAEPLLVETLFRLKKYGEAEKLLRARLAGIRRGHGRKKAGSYRERSTLLLLATAYLREGRERGFLRSVRTLTRAFPKSAEARRALFMEGLYFEEAGKWPRAIAIYGRVLKAGGRKPSAEAAWRRGWLLYRMGRYSEAYRSLGLPVSTGPGMAARLAYWRGRALEKAGDGARAREEYAKACEGWMPGYYCFMAQKRLGAKTIVQDRRRGGQADVQGAAIPGGDALYAPVPEEGRLRKALTLLSVGLTDEASKEAELALRERRPGRSEVLSLMMAFYSAGDYYHAVRLFENYAGLLRAEDGTMPEEFLEVAFPLRLVEYISSRGLAGEADPLLVAAVMREESAFDPDTISRTGAVGLMQVMPSTAEFIASASTGGKPRPYDLGDPDTNIRMGAWYLAYLWRRTGGSAIETIAGYNAGLNMVRKWRKRYPLDDDEFIESIPYRETRNYTKKVLKSYRAFTMLAAGRRPLLLSMEAGEGRHGDDRYKEGPVSEKSRW